MDQSCRNEVFSLGVRALRKKEYITAENYFRQALTPHSSHRVDIIFQLGLSLEMQDRHQEAEVLYHEILSSEGPPAIRADAWFRTGWLARQARSIPQAIRAFAQAALLFENIPASENRFHESSYWWALSYEESGELLRAIDIYKKLMVSDNWFWDSSYRLICCYDKLGLFDKVLDLCQLCQRRNKQKPAPEKNYHVLQKIAVIQHHVEQLDTE